MVKRKTNKYKLIDWKYACSNFLSGFTNGIKNQILKQELIFPDKGKDIPYNWTIKKKNNFQIIDVEAKEK